MNRRFTELGQTSPDALVGVAVGDRACPAPRFLVKMKTAVQAVIDWFAEF